MVGSKSIRSARRRISVTTDGKWFFVLMSGVGFAALNTSNNLLFLLLAMMMSVLLVDGWISSWMLRKINVKRQLPIRASAGDTFFVELQIRSRHRRNIAFSIELRDWVDGDPFRRSCYFLRVQPGESRGIAYRCEWERRGILPFTGVSASTSFPFGFLESSRIFPLNDSMLIWPDTIPLQIPDALSGDSPGERLLSVRSEQGEFRQIRPYQDADDPRLISWKVSAAKGELQIRELQATSGSEVKVVLDVDSFRHDTEMAEQAIRAAATAVEALCSLDCPVSLVIDDDSVSFRSEGSDHLWDMLDALARIDLSRTPDRSVVAQDGDLYIGNRETPAGVFRISIPPHVQRKKA